MKIKQAAVIYGYLVLLTLIIISLINIGSAEASSPAPLPTAAQEAVNKGIEAAKLPDYQLAIKKFEEARKVAPKAPVVYLNLGLAESKISGRELRAIAWFGAYLAAYPDAPNAAAVRDQIALLDAKSQRQISLMIKTLKDEAYQAPKSEWWLKEQLGGELRLFQFKDVIELLQMNDSFEEAIKITDDIPNHYEKSWILLAIGTAQEEAGDPKAAGQTFASAMHTALFLKPENIGFSRVSAITSNIAGAHAETGDIAGALESVNSLSDDYFKSQAQFVIAKVQAKAGDMAGYKTTYTLADRTAGFITKTDQKKEVQDWIADEKKKIDAGKFDEAAAQDIGKIHPSVAAKDWVSQNDTVLNDPVFLDLDTVLKATASRQSERQIFEATRDTAKKIIEARQLLTQMLKQQAKL